MAPSSFPVLGEDQCVISGLRKMLAYASGFFAGFPNACPLQLGAALVSAGARCTLPLAFSPCDLYPAPFDSILPGAERKVLARSEP